MTRDQLAEVYYDWFNNYLTIEHYAEVNGLTEKEAIILIELAESCTNNPHPEA